MATVIPLPVDQQVVLLADIDWETYERIIEAFADQRFRHTYADGMLEIIAPLNRHEWIKKLIGRIVEMISWRLRIPIYAALGAPKIWRMTDDVRAFYRLNAQGKYIKFAQQGTSLLYLSAAGKASHAAFSARRKRSDPRAAARNQRSLTRPC